MELAYEGDWLIKELAKKKATRALAKRFERVRALDSIRLDLENAAQAVAALLKAKEGLVEETSISVDQANIDRGLATFSIIAYARSTDTKSDQRNSFDPRRFYSKQQIDWHESIIRLRDEAIAHFGSGRHPGGSWARDSLLVIIDQDSSSIRFGWRYDRSNYQGRVILELSKLLPLALNGVEQDRGKLTRSILREIEVLSDEFLEALSSCPWTVYEDRPQQQLYTPVLHILKSDET